MAEIRAQGINLQCSRLDGATLICADLSQASGHDVSFRWAIMPVHENRRVVLYRATLPNVDFTGAAADGICLEGADLCWAKLDQADMDGACLKNATLNKVTATGAKLSGVNFDGANLDQANFSGANLVRASLGGTSTNGTNFEGADLRGATGLPGAEKIAQREEWDKPKFEAARFGDPPLPKPER
jgi:secreted effector protein PipB2